MNDSSNATTIVQLPSSFCSLTKDLYIYGVPVICVLGLLGNIVSFKVFLSANFSSQSSSTYIVALSMSDAGFLVFRLLVWLGNGRVGVRYADVPFFCYTQIFVTHVCSFLSVWYVVLIMVDRYIVVCHSLRVPEWCTKRRSRVATLIVTVFGIIFYTPTFFKENSCYGDPIFIFLYIDTALTFIIPFTIIIFLNAMVIASIKRFQVQHVLIKDRSRHVRSFNILSKAQFRITRTLTLVSIVMLVTNVPSHGIRLYLTVAGSPSQSRSMYCISYFFSIIYDFNYAVNFLIYSVSSDKFRKYLSYKNICSFYYQKQALRKNNHLYG